MSRYPTKKPGAKKVARTKKSASSKAKARKRQKPQAQSAAAKLAPIRARNVSKQLAADSMSAVHFGASVASVRPRGPGLLARLRALLERGFNRLVGAKSAE